jgi:hypothetical protein
MVHPSHRFGLGNHYCAWCGKSSERAVDKCDYNLITTNPNWKPSDFVLAEALARNPQLPMPTLPPEAASSERERLKESLRRKINKTIARLSALESGT